MSYDFEKSNLPITVTVGTIVYPENWKELKGKSFSFQEGEIAPEWMAFLKTEEGKEIPALTFGVDVNVLVGEEDVEIQPLGKPGQAVLLFTPGSHLSGVPRKIHPRP